MTYTALGQSGRSLGHDGTEDGEGADDSSEGLHFEDLVCVIAWAGKIV